MEQLQRFLGGVGPAMSRLVLGTGSITTLRATARLRLQNGQLSDMRRTVSALVKFAPTTKDAPYHVLRWYDQGAWEWEISSERPEAISGHRNRRRN